MQTVPLSETAMSTIHRMLDTQVQQWVALERQKSQSLVTNLLHHINAGKLRPPQKQAIEIYLWIKFVGKNKKLSEIIKDGLLHDANLASRYENYVLLENFKNYVILFLNQFFQDNAQKNLQRKLLNDPEGEHTDWNQFLEQLLHNFAYPNYLYSLPMGAGKTFLIACFIYLDLYFARLFKNDTRFAHNFIVFAPHAAKTAILPSLKTIKDFDPTWVLPEKDANQIKQLITFEILDKLSSARRDKLHGNNPNLEKVNRLKQTQQLGLVFITNAEKVVLERYSDADQIIVKNKKKGLPSLLEEVQLKKTNELREALSQLPQLAVVLDEVHHAYGNSQSGEKKLRQAIDVLNQHKNLTVVLGLSGTPYAKSKISIAGETIRLNQIQDIVYHYPLNHGIGRFLKTPHIVGKEIVEEAFLQTALDEFFGGYDRQYTDNTKSKIAFYCPTIKKLNEDILPVVKQWYQHNRPGKEDEIFRYYSAVDKQNKAYKLPKDSNAIFNNLDRPHSTKRVILLVAIGKEGWDCRSLTSVVLPRQSTPKNFVLQTTCRCLREVDDAANETALIYLSSENYETLDRELRENYKLSISDLSRSTDQAIEVQVRKPKLGKLKYKQVGYHCEIVKRTTPEIKSVLRDFKFADLKKHYPYDSKTTQGRIGASGLIEKRRGEYQFPASASASDSRYPYAEFLHQLCRAAYGLVSESELQAECATELRGVYQQITENADWLANNPHLDWIGAAKHLAAEFMQRTEYVTHAIVADETQIELLQWHGSGNELSLISPGGQAYKFMPRIEENFQMYQKHPEDMEKDLAKQIDQNDISFNYAPYKMDSAFEQNALAEMLKFVELENLELYFNGYKESGKLQSFWIQTPRGRYTPDFLILKRKGAPYRKDNAQNDSHNKTGNNKRDKIRNATAIAKVLIIETKGEPYYDSEFKAKESFIKGDFLEHNPQFTYHCFRGEDRAKFTESHKQELKSLLDNF